MAKPKISKLPPGEEVKAFFEKHSDKTPEEMLHYLAQGMLNSPDHKRVIMENMRKAGCDVDNMEIFKDIRLQ